MSVPPSARPWFPFPPSSFIFGHPIDEHRGQSGHKSACVCLSASFPLKQPTLRTVRLDDRAHSTSRPRLHAAMVNPKTTYEASRPSPSSSSSPSTSELERGGVGEPGGNQSEVPKDYRRMFNERAAMTKCEQGGKTEEGIAERRLPQMTVIPSGGMLEAG